LEPLTTVCLIRTGWPIDARIGLLRSRFSAASRAKRLTCCSGARSGASCGSPFSDVSIRVCALRSPRIWTSPTSGNDNLPPLTTRSRYVADCLSTASLSAASASASRERIVDST
jgi:hypothetical protein